MLEKKNSHQIREMLVKHPLAKEVLYVAASQKLPKARYPFLTVNQVSACSQKDIQISDFDTADPKGGWAPYKGVCNRGQWACKGLEARKNSIYSAEELLKGLRV